MACRGARATGMRRLLPLLAVLAALLCLAVPGVAQDSFRPEIVEQKLVVWDREAQQVDERLAAGDLTSAELERLRPILADQRAEIPPLQADLERRIAPVETQLEALGPPPGEGESEAEPIARERAALSSRLEELTGLARRLDQALARAQSLTAEISTLRREFFTERILSRGPSIFEDALVPRGLAAIAATAVEIYEETAGRLGWDTMSLGRLGPAVLLGLVLLGPVILLLGIRRAVMARLSRLVTGNLAPARKIVLGLGLTVARLLVPAVVVTAIVSLVFASGVLGPQGEALMEGLARTMLLVAAAHAIGSAYFAPQMPELRLSALGNRAASRANRWLMALTAIAGLDQVFLESTTGLAVPIEGLTLVNIVLLAFGGAALWRFEHTIRLSQPEPAENEEPPDEDEEKESAERFTLAILPILLQLERWILLLIAVAAPLLAAAGYFAASRFAFYTPLFTGALIAFFVLLFTVVREVVIDVLVPSASGTRAASRLRLIPVTVGFLLTVLAVPLAMLIWGADTADLRALWTAISRGFSIGAVTVSPVDFLLFLAVFGVGYIVTRLVQGIVSGSVLPLTRLDSGGRAAVIAAIGYGGIFLAALVAIATTGLDLSSIAIVAGALSVGIGFGLQNIVNNFVSGLILLLERPIKAGDWVELASGMGYVKKVNVRSTEIETFDRASLFVPNSELISSTVTNWTHSNLTGRVIVPVHVAYGTDVRQVESELLAIAKGHPMMLRKPAPFVLFRRFGESALHFEVRGFLRDINWVLNVQSDINFEILRRFGERGIAIPVTQAEVRLREGAPVPPVSGSASHAPRPPGDEPPAGWAEGDGAGDGGAGDGR